MSIPPFERLHFSRYRCFRDRNEIVLGRLNLVYGVNNVGKSALVRLPALIADSLTPGQPGLNGASEVLGKSAPKSLIWRGSLPDGPSATFGIEHGGVGWSWKIMEEDTLQKRLKTTVEVTGADGNVHRFEDEADALDGLLPSSADVPRTELARTLGDVVWLAANRRGPAHVGGIDRRGRLWFDGRSAGPELLAKRDRIPNISRFYEQHTERVLLVEGHGTDHEHLRLETKGDVTFRVTFDESGSGLRHVFPVLAALEAVREGGGLLIVEEPESHLNPKLERALAEHTVEVLRANPAAQVLFETHSEIFLLAALNAAVAADGLGADAVKLHWVEPDTEGASTVTPVTLDQHGRPTSRHLSKAFGILGEMRREIVQNRRYGS